MKKKRNFWQSGGGFAEGRSRGRRSGGRGGLEGPEGGRSGGKNVKHAQKMLNTPKNVEHVHIFWPSAVWPNAVKTLKHHLWPNAVWPSAVVGQMRIFFGQKRFFGQMRSGQMRSGPPGRPSSRTALRQEEETNFGQSRFVLANPFWDLVCVMVGPRREGGGAKGGGPKISRFFFWCLKRRDPQMCMFGLQALGLSCATPASREGLGRRVQMGRFDGFE